MNKVEVKKIDCMEFLIKKCRNPDSKMLLCLGIYDDPFLFRMHKESYINNLEVSKYL